MAASIFNARLAQDFDPNLSRLNRKITSNKTKHFLVENELEELKEFSEKSTLGILFIFLQLIDLTQKMVLKPIQPTHRYFKLIANTKHIAKWKSKGLSDESIKPITTSDNSLALLISYYGYKIRLKFNGSILRQVKVTYTQ